MNLKLKIVAMAVAALLMGALSTGLPAEPLPSRLAGSWRVTKILPTQNVTCMDAAEEQKLVGTTISYSAKAIRWHGGTVPIQEIVVRTISADDFRNENSGSGQYQVDLNQLGIHAASVVEVDFQHEDADVVGCGTEIPGDSVLLAGPNRIVFGLSGTFYEATRMKAAR